LAKVTRRYGTKYCLYAFRHTWCNRALKNGVDPITVSVLMGHADTSMLAKVYQHLGPQLPAERGAASCHLNRSSAEPERYAAKSYTEVSTGNAL
jgi:hypothetical protein